MPVGVPCEFFSALFVILSGVLCCDFVLQTVSFEN